MVAEMLVMEEGIQKAGDENFACIAESSFSTSWTKKKDARFIRWEMCSSQYFTVLECRKEDKISLNPVIWVVAEFNPTRLIN